MPKIYDKMTAAYGQAGVDRKVADASQIYDEDAHCFQSDINAKSAEVLVVPYGYDMQTDDVGLLLSTEEFLSIVAGYRAGKHVMVAKYCDEEVSYDLHAGVTPEVRVALDEQTGAVRSATLTWNDFYTEANGIKKLSEYRIDYQSGGTPQFTRQDSRITPEDPLPSAVTVVDKVQESRIVPCWLHKGQTLCLLKDSYYATYCLRMFGNGKYKQFNIGEEVEVVRAEYLGGPWSVEVLMLGVGGITFLMQEGVHYSYSLNGVVGRYIPIPCNSMGTFTLPPAAKDLKISYYGSTLRRLVFAGDYFGQLRRGVYRNTGVAGTSLAWEKIPCRSHIVAPNGSYKRYDLSNSGLNVSEPTIECIPWKKTGEFSIGPGTSQVSPNWFINSSQISHNGDYSLPHLVILVRRRVRNGHKTDGRYNKTEYAPFNNQRLLSLLLSWMEYEKGNVNNTPAATYLQTSLVANADKTLKRVLRYIDIAIAFQLRNHRGNVRMSHRYSVSRIYYRLYNKGSGKWVFTRQ